MKRMSVFVILLVLAVFLAVNVSAKQNDLPILSPALSVISNDLEMKKSGLCNTKLYFSSDDFEDFLRLENVKAVTVTALPSAFQGKLYLGSTEITANQTVQKADLDKLYFVPNSSDIKTASFCFYGEGASCEASIKCSLFFLSKINTAPVITLDVFEKESLMTTKNIMVYSTLYADDAENDALVFEIADEASHGIVTFVDEKNGRFTYTPATDYVGKDSFSFTVCDEYGNRSEKATVEIKVNKGKDNVFYSDMVRHQDHNDAVKITEYGIMSGKLVKGKMCFLPESTPSKAEFISMAMQAAGFEDNYTAATTMLTDDADILPQHRGYITKALELGFVTGTKNENGVFLYPNEPITRAEAAVILNGMLGYDDTSLSLEFTDKTEIPSWAADDISALAQMDIVRPLTDGSYSPNMNITNCQTATILRKVFELKNK